MCHFPSVGIGWNYWCRQMQIAASFLFPVYSRAWDQVCVVNCGSHSKRHAVGAHYIGWICKLWYHQKFIAQFYCMPALETARKRKLMSLDCYKEKYSVFDWKENVGTLWFEMIGSTSGFSCWLKIEALHIIMGHWSNYLSYSLLYLYSLIAVWYIAGA